VERPTLYFLVFVLVTGPLLTYNVVLPSVEVRIQSCPAIFADLSVDASGFTYAVGEPWLSAPQLVLPQSSTAKIILTYTSFGNNLSQMYLEPRGAFGFDYKYLYPVGSSSPLKTEGTGISIAVTNTSFPSIHEAVFVLTVSASASARQGAYGIWFPSTCGDGYYLVVGNVPYLLPTPGVLSPLSLVIFDVLVGSLAVLVVHFVLTLHDGRRKRPSDGDEGAGGEGEIRREEQ
jgi:hypothetical protein